LLTLALPGEVFIVARPCEIRLSIR